MITFSKAFSRDMEYNLRFYSKDGDMNEDMNEDMDISMSMNMNIDEDLNRDISVNMSSNMNLSSNMNITNVPSDFSNTDEFTELVQLNDYNALNSWSTLSGGRCNSSSNAFPSRKSSSNATSSININIYDWNSGDLYNCRNNNLAVELNEIIKLCDRVPKRDFGHYGFKQTDNNFSSFNCNYNYGTVDDKRDVVMDKNQNGRLDLTASSTVKNEVLSCSYCNKLFTRKSDLTSHMRKHSIVKPFECAICSKSFARHSDLKRHNSVHVSYKKFQCKGMLGNGCIWGCGNFYSRSDGLRKHFKSRSGKKCISELIGEIKFEHVGDKDRDKDKDKDKDKDRDNDNDNDKKDQIDYLSKAFQNTRLFHNFTNR